MHQPSFHELRPGYPPSLVVEEEDRPQEPETTSPESRYGKISSMRIYGKGVLSAIGALCQSNEDDSQINKKRVRELQHSSEIVDIRELRETNTEDGTLYRFGFETAAGNAHDSYVGIPSEQRSDIPVLGKPAWLMALRGHNTNTMRGFMRAGNPVIFIGEAGSYRPSKIPVPQEPNSLELSAATSLAFSDEISSDFHGKINSRLRTSYGESGAGMTAMGTQAYAEHFDQEIIWGDYQAPCFPRGIEIGDVPDLAEQFMNEPIALARMLGGLSLPQIVRLGRSFEKHPYSLLHQLAIGPALLSGEAGVLAKRIHPNKLIHMTIFDGDSMSMGSDWERIFEGNSNALISRFKGYHSSFLRPKAGQSVHARHRAFHEIYSVKGSDATGGEVLCRAHEIVDEGNARR